MSEEAAGAVPEGGIHVQSAMKSLYEYLIEGKSNALVYPKPEMYPPDANHTGGGSENMKELYCSVDFVRGSSTGSQRRLKRYQATARTGHAGGEIASRTHSQLHEGAHGSNALWAYRQGDKEILDLAVEWLQRECFLLSLTEITGTRDGVLDGMPWTAGARAVRKVKGTETPRELTLRLGDIRELKLSLRDYEAFPLSGAQRARMEFLKAVRGGRVQRNQTNLGAACAALLPKEIRARILERPKLSTFYVQGDLEIGRSPSGSFYMLFRSLPVVEGGTRAAGYNREEQRLWICRDSQIDDRLNPMIVSEIEALGDHELVEFPTPPRKAGA